MFRGVLADMISIEEIGSSPKQRGDDFFFNWQSGAGVGAKGHGRKFFQPDRKTSNTEFHSS